MLTLKEEGVFTFKVYKPNGELRTERKAHNTMTNEGANRILRLSFDTGATAAVDTIYTGLISSTVPNSNIQVAATNTATNIKLDTASSPFNNNWTELVNTGITSRPTSTLGFSSASNKVAFTDATFNITTNTETTAGAFIVSNSVNGSTTGNLFACALFTSGNLTIEAGETVKVTFEMTLNP